MNNSGQKKSRRSFLKNATLGGIAGTLMTANATTLTSAEEKKEKKSRRKRSPIGVALALGLNSVDPSHYSGWEGKLNACEFDANLMESIANSRGFSQVTKLLTKKATRGNFFNELNKAAEQLKSGDLFVLSYSGHGGQLPDRDGDEVDNLDETWCLYDSQIIDDEMNKAWTQFKKGVRILVFSDSCHSGTVTKSTFYKGLSKLYTYSDKPTSWPDVTSHSPGFMGFKNGMTGDLSTRFDYLDTKTKFSANVDFKRPEYRYMPTDYSFKTYQKNKDFYDEIISKTKVKPGEIQASVLLISGCQDNQLSLDGWDHGKFTGQLKRVWDDGDFNGTYKQFHAKILNGMPATQSPNYFFTGKENSEFEGQKPYTI